MQAKRSANRGERAEGYPTQKFPWRDTLRPLPYCIGREGEVGVTWTPKEAGTGRVTAEGQKGGFAYFGSMVTRALFFSKGAISPATEHSPKTRPP